MSQSFDVANAKSRLSELFNRASYGKERFLIRKHGHPVAAIVSVDDLLQLEHSSATKPTGILAASEALKEFDDYSAILDEIVQDRQNRPEREVSVV